MGTEQSSNLLALRAPDRQTVNAPKPNLTWIRFVVFGLAFVGVFLAGVYAGNVQPFTRIFGQNGSPSSGSSSSPKYESVSILTNATINLPANGIPVLLGNVTTAGNSTI